MKNIQKLKLNKKSTLKEALEIIDSGAMQIALVVDSNDRLIGTITDGDIRRGFLKGLSLDSSIDSIIYATPTTAQIGDTKEEILKVAVSKKLHQIPVLDNNGRVVDLLEIDELLKPKEKSNRVVLMVGGLGSRLRPLTKTTPKPMLKVGSKPILQTIIEKFVEYGYTNFILCVNYKSHIIKKYFGDGSNFGVKIEYVHEKKQMGTAGALSLIEEPFGEPFFVMNGDLLTNVNFDHLEAWHIANDATATMCVREYEFQVPYGVVEVEDGKVVSIKEKPTHKFFVSAGIYMLSPKALEFVPKNQFFDMPTLFEKLIELNKSTVSFPLREYWLDIGRVEEYEKANEEYNEVF